MATALIPTQRAEILPDRLNVRRPLLMRLGASNIVLLTQLGGSAFGNDDDWIHAAMRRALSKAKTLSFCGSARLPESYGLIG
jgi:hypothetical protein